MKTNIYLETKRALLRPISDDDGGFLFELNSDPDVMKYLAPEHQNIDEANQAAIRISNINKKYNHQLGIFAAIEKETSELFGWFILRPDKVDLENIKNLELGYRLFKKAWGKGLGTEVAKELLEQAKTEYQVKRVFATAMKANDASINIMKKIGLNFEKEYVEERFQGNAETAVMYSTSF